MAWDNLPDFIKVIKVEWYWHKEPRNKSKLTLKLVHDRGAWVAQLVKPLTSAQVVVSQFVDSSPESGSVQTAWSLDPPLDSVSPSLSAPLLLTLSLSFKINKHKKRERNPFYICTKNNKILTSKQKRGKTYALKNIEH